MRESGTEGISALLSDVMNIKNGSEFLCFYLSKSKNIFSQERLPRTLKERNPSVTVFLCNVYADRQGLESRSGPGFFKEN